ncbi:MAG: efflux RND transporter periplasmic adaptor subunit [Chitinophagaceae bacterium]
MQQVVRPTLAILFLLFAMACGDSKKEREGALGEKKATVAKMKADYAKQGEAIKKLEDEIALLDTNADAAAKVKLVSVAAVSTENFEHYIDLQGKIDAENISYISPRGMGGQVKALYVQAGQLVKKGQLLLKLDDAVVRQQIVAAKQGLETIRTQLSFAKNIYQRQKNLWDQNIGTEVQLISAKNNVESLENQLRATEENVKVITEQLNTANVYSDVTGIADQVNIKVGETFTGMTASGPQIKIVNTSSLKVVTNVPENYISRLHTGSGVQITIPDANKKLNASISLISQSIDPTMRGFMVEAKIPYDPALKPNQSAIIKILDYSANNAVVIPVNLVQSDETSKYVYVLEKQGNGKTIARKKVVLIGEVYGDKVEIKTGLSAGEQIITEGYQNLYEGQSIATG